MLKRKTPQKIKWLCFTVKYNFMRKTKKNFCIIFLFSPLGLFECLYEEVADKFSKKEGNNFFFFFFNKEN